MAAPQEGQSKLYLYLVTVFQNSSFILQSLVAAEDKEKCMEMMNQPMPEDFKVLLRIIGETSEGNRRIIATSSNTPINQRNTVLAHLAGVIEGLKNGKETILEKPRMKVFCVSGISKNMILQAIVVSEDETQSNLLMQAFLPDDMEPIYIEVGKAYSGTPYVVLKSDALFKE